MYIARRNDGHGVSIWREQTWTTRQYSMLAHNGGDGHVEGFELMVAKFFMPLTAVPCSKVCNAPLRSEIDSGSIMKPFSLAE